jgi:hypothetical protein
LAKRLTYIQNHDGNRRWTIEPFNDGDFNSNDYIYLCQHSDGHLTELDIVKIPRNQWNELVELVSKSLEEFDRCKGE